MKHENAMPADKDVVDYVHALQALYGVAIVFELKPNNVITRPKWKMIAKAFDTDGELVLPGSIMREVFYPSVDHKTLAGAMLKAAYELEGALAPWYWLKNMGHDK